MERGGGEKKKKKPLRSGFTFDALVIRTNQAPRCDRMPEEGEGGKNKVSLPVHAPYDLVLLGPSRQPRARGKKENARRRSGIGNSPLSPTPPSPRRNKRRRRKKKEKRGGEKEKEASAPPKSSYPVDRIPVPGCQLWQQTSSPKKGGEKGTAPTPHCPLPENIAANSAHPRASRRICQTNEKKKRKGISRTKPSPSR